MISQVQSTGAVASAAGAHAGLFQALLEAAGPVRECLDRLRGLDLPHAAKAEIYRLEEVASLVTVAMPDLALTADPCEHKGFEYQTGRPGRALSCRAGRGLRGARDRLHAFHGHRSARLAAGRKT